MKKTAWLCGAVLFLLTGALIVWRLFASTPIEDIQSSDRAIRQKAVSRLAKSATPEEVDELCRLLQHAGDADVRHDCAATLGYARATKAVPYLILAMEDQDWRVRRIAVMSLGVIGDPRASVPLTKLLWDAKPELQYHVIRAFTGVKCAEVVPRLLDMLSQKAKGNGSENIDHVKALLSALAAQKDRRAIPVLVGLLDGPYAKGAAATLGAIVGQDFNPDQRRGGIQAPGDPAKAKAWLARHPEVLNTKTDE